MTGEQRYEPFFAIKIRRLFGRGCQEWTTYVFSQSSQIGIFTRSRSMQQKPLERLQWGVWMGGSTKAEFWMGTGKEVLTRVKKGVGGAWRCLCHSTPCLNFKRWMKDRDDKGPNRQHMNLNYCASSAKPRTSDFTIYTIWGPMAEPWAPIL